jgi:hypothetical protein
MPLLRLSRAGCAYQQARSSGTGWSSRHWPRAWPGSSAGADSGRCPSGWRTGSSRLFFSAECIVSCVLACGHVRWWWWWWWAYLAILKLEHQLHLVALDLLLNDLGGNPAVGWVGLPCPGAVLVDVCHVGGRVPRPLLYSGGRDCQGPRLPSSGGYTGSSSLVRCGRWARCGSACRIAALTAISAWPGGLCAC